MLSLTSAAWEAEMFYCRGCIIDTCRAMFESFLRGEQSKRRGDAWRTFCRYVRYLKHSFTVRQGTQGSKLTKTEQGHIPAVDTTDGLTDIFALLTITLLLNVIDCRQYPGTSAPLSLREVEEIRLAQSDAFMLVEFLDGIIDLVDDGTGEPASVENAFFSYFILQGRWLLWQLKPAAHIQHDEVRGRLSAAEFLLGNDAQELLKGDIWKEWAGEAPDCFTPLDQALKIGFPKFTQENTKRKSIQNSSKQLSKRRKQMDGE
jgi:hypothetical protein